MGLAHFVIYILAFLLGFMLARIGFVWRLCLMWNDPSGRKELSDKFDELSDAMNKLKRDAR